MYHYLRRGTQPMGLAVSSATAVLHPKGKTMTKAQQIIAACISPNDQNNISTRQAQALGVLMSKWDMPWLTIVAQPVNPAGGAVAVPIADVIAAGVPLDTPLNYYGRTSQAKPGDDDELVAPLGDNLGEELLMRNNTDPLNWFIKVYTEHHQGSNQDQALAAATQLRSFVAFLPQAMAAMVDAAGF